MAKLTKDQVLHIADLSKLNLSEAEIKKITPQLSSIIEYVETLNEVDTENIEPTAQVTGLTNVYRDDEVNPIGSLSQDEALCGTEENYNGYFKVGAILSERTDK
jgi:aspartyl-tRNA(Asn)/glutamyl-tRNA(Gln) amidotransferase subunit C